MNLCSRYSFHSLFFPLQKSWSQKKCKTQCKCKMKIAIIIMPNSKTNCAGKKAQPSSHPHLPQSFHYSPSGALCIVGGLAGQWYIMLNPVGCTLLLLLLVKWINRLLSTFINFSFYCCNAFCRPNAPFCTYCSMFTSAPVPSPPRHTVTSTSASEGTFLYFHFY